MELNRKTRRQLRLQSTGFALLFLAAVGMLAWLSTRYHYEADWTAAGRHTLSEVSTALLEKMEGPIHITSYAREEGASASRRVIADLVSRYRREKPDIELEFVNPDLVPERVRKEGITLEGEMVVEYRGRTENVQNASEQALTNALQRLAREGERKLVFLSGHGERSPHGRANHDLSTWVAELEKQGFAATTLNLTQSPEIPPDTGVLVIAGPQVDLLPGEVDLLRKYVSEGGSLLWLTDPGERHGLQPLAQELGIGFVPGVIVDPTTQMLGIDNPAFVIVADYPPHPVTEELGAITLFPKAVGLILSSPEGWAGRPLLRTVPRSWAETGEMSGTIQYDQGADRPGPIGVGVTLSRSLRDGESRKTQRVAVIGDGDFLSTAYLGNGANAQLGTRLVKWLSRDDAFITIPAKTAPDTRLALTRTLSIIIGVGFLVILPGALLGSGIWIWLRRRKR